MEEIRKSINSILYERLTSPLYGTLIISWLIWNWKIVYITLFVSEEILDKNKVDYIVENYNNICNLIWFPALSCFILLTIMPFVANGAFWLNIQFDDWKSKQKKQVEGKQLLTFDQSMELREEILKQENKYKGIITSKDSEIKQLKLLVEKYSERSDLSPIILDPKAEPVDLSPIITETQDNFTPIIEPQDDSIVLGEVSTGFEDSTEVITSASEKMATKILRSDPLMKSFDQINYLIQNNYRLDQGPESIDADTVLFFESNGIVEKNNNLEYQFTAFGLQVAKEMLKHKF